MLLLMRVRIGNPEDLHILAADQIDHLPSNQLRRQISLAGRRINQDREELFVETEREVVFPQAPARLEPIARDEKNDCLATACCFMQLALPPFADRDTLLDVDVEKNVFPSFRLKPVEQGESGEIVLARMTQENARHRTAVREQ